MVPLLILSKLAAIVAIPLSKDFSDKSINFTVKPLWAKVWAIPTHCSCSDYCYNFHLIYI
jgi:hypothetical protein